MKAATAKKKKAPLEQWHVDFQNLLKDVIRDHKEEIRKELRKTKKAQKDYRSDTITFDPYFDNNQLLLTTVVLWIFKNGTKQQKDITKTWIENMYAEMEGKK